MRYSRRISGPVLDRLDVMVHVDRPSPTALLDREPGEASSLVAQRVARVRELALSRGARTNAGLNREQLEDAAPLDPEATDVLHQALTDGRLSARGAMRVRAVARTIRDLDDAGPTLRARDVYSAIGFRVRPPMGSFDA